ncbi:MAG: glutathione S-transferase [Pseudomonadota bacterium]|jgi:glutathione S-transferase|nr:glutathione S-transferase [Pseudomonadota bacterium]
MIIVHHLEDSRSQRVLWLLEELGVPYEVKRYNRDPNTSLAPPELLQVHPLGKSPVITDGDVTVAETGAIFEYLVDTYDTDARLRPANGKHAARAYTYWLHYAEGSAMTNLLLKLVFSRLPERAPMLMKPIVKKVSASAEQSFIDPRIAEHTTWWNTSLADTGYFVGNDLTAADIMMSFPLEAASSRADLAPFPHVKEFLERIHARPAYQKALEKGGPYAFA